MKLERLIEALHGAGTDLHVEDILDAFWLATRGKTLSLHASRPPTSRLNEVPPSGIEEPESARHRADAAAESVPPSEERIFPESDATAPVYAPGDAGATDSTVRASPVALPAGYALTGRLPLSRALRPFRQRWPSRHQEELDEERTAEATAELHGQLHPVFHPSQERWFDVDVVLEDDPAIGVWRDTLRDFTQMLRDTGAFRNVRSWRLRMPTDTTAAPAGRKQSPALETSNGSRTAAQALGGRGVRRLVFFATHGSSERWLDGSYARLLAPWLHGSSVVLLHLLQREHWKRGVLGEPHGLCYVQEPGAVTSALYVERFWWALTDDDQGVIRVPAIPLTASGLTEFSHMQMARGRRCPVFLLDPNPPPMEDVEPAPPREFERAVALLREVSPNAFRLAVYLSAGAFTIPVARLVQEAKLGAAVQQQHLAEVLLSGLVFARSPQDVNADPNELYYEFYPEARSILMRSLRDADAELIADALERRVSQYIEEIFGRAITFRALVPDENGRYDLPRWAQPFARLGLALLGTSAPGMTAAQLLKEFRNSNALGVVVKTAQIAAATPLGGVLDPRAIDAELWRAIMAARLVRQNANGQWSFLPGLEPLLKRIAEREPLEGVSLLWVDDHSENNENEVARFRSLGALVDLAEDTEQALRSMEVDPHHVIISDMARGSNPDAGFDLLRRLRTRGAEVPVIIYTAGFASDSERRERALRAGAFECTNAPQELLALILEASGRSPSLQATAARQSRVMEVLRSIGIARASGSKLFIGSPRSIAEQVLNVQTDHRKALQNHLRVIQAFAASPVNQLIRVDGNTLRVIAAVIDPEKKGSLYTIAAWEGLIGRAAREAEVVWAPDVSRVAGYIRAEPSTRSELVLPLTLRTHVGVTGVVNIEMDEINALIKSDIDWLVEFCAPLAPRVLVVPRGDLENVETDADDNARPTTVARSDTEIDESYAAIIGCSDYQDPKLPLLRSALDHAEAVRSVLQNPSINIKPQNILYLRNPKTSDIQRSLDSFTAARGARLLVFYFNGHGVLSADGELILATTDLDIEALYATSYTLRDLRYWIARFGARQNLVILDTSYGGRAAVELGDQMTTRMPLGSTAVLSSSGPNEVAMDRGPNERLSPFTDALVRGLATGEADADRDGQITVRDLYEYIIADVRRWSFTAQTPSLHTYGVETDFVVSVIGHGEQGGKNGHDSAIPRTATLEVREPVASPYIVGAPVPAERMAGRRDIFNQIRAAWAKPGQRDSLVIYGNRRMGKTSIARNLLHFCRFGPDTGLAFLNLQAVDWSQGLVDLCYAIEFELWKALPIELAEPLPADFEEHPLAKLRGLLARLDRQAGRGGYILVLDEYELIDQKLVQTAADDFIALLRGLTQQYPWLVMALVGLHTLQERTASFYQAIFAWRGIRVGLMDRDSFAAMLQVEHEDFPLEYSPEAVDRAYVLTGGQPFLGQLLGDSLVRRFNGQLRHDLERPSPTFSVEDVDAVVAEAQFYRDGNAYFDGIWAQAGEAPAGQHAVLTALCGYANGLDATRLRELCGLDPVAFDAVLDALERHDVLTTSDGHYRYSVELMRRWVRHLRDGQ